MSGRVLEVTDQFFSMLQVAWKGLGSQGSAGQILVNCALISCFKTLSVSVDIVYSTMLQSSYVNAQFLCLKQRLVNES